jgi:L,D-transpeptidase YbiS
MVKRAGVFMINPHVIIDSATQELRLMKNNILLNCFSISTAKNGLGERLGSGCTPRGLHYIRAKIGADLDPATVFVSRRPTGELYTPQLASEFINRDWILGRILWLCGKEQGLNRLGQVDTMQRFIYIHGSPDGSFSDLPSSHGCIRMTMDDVCFLFDAVKVGYNVIIK